MLFPSAVSQTDQSLTNIPPAVSPEPTLTPSQLHLLFAALVNSARDTVIRFFVPLVAVFGDTTPASLQLSPRWTCVHQPRGTLSRDRRLVSGVAVATVTAGSSQGCTTMTTITANSVLKDAAHINSHVLNSSTNIDGHTTVCVGYPKHVRYWTRAVH